MEPRAARLVEKLERGRQKTAEVFSALKPEQWELILYPDPPWQVRNLLAHFISSERQLLALCQSIAAGGPGLVPEFDIDRNNAHQQEQFVGISPQVLLQWLEEARCATITWIGTLTAVQLEKVGRHPVLGDLTVETMVESVYGHQLFHMRDLLRLLQGVV
jgi:DinB superfamily